MKLEKEISLNLYQQMLRIRLVEEAIADAYPQQKMRTPVHLSIGQEAVAAASGLALRKTDYAVGTHRAHAHYLAKGGSLKAMIAELYGKVTGCCRGRGGSMHLVDQSVGFMGSTAIVANTIPIGVGLGLSIQLEGSKRVSCVFIGDGAVEEGVFYESLNFAIVRQLPVLFICENNLYSVYTPISKRQPKHRKIHELTKAIGASTLSVDGYNVNKSYEAISFATEEVRGGSGPYVVELSTYRWREHCGPYFDNDLGYRDVHEYEQWEQKDSLKQQKQLLTEHFSIQDHVFQDIKIAIDEEIKAAFAYAEQSEFPDIREGLSGEYKTSLSKEAALCEA